MGTLFQALIPISKGILFQESFEPDSWVTDNGWVTVNGYPVNSTNQYYDGVKSFVMDSSFPFIKQTLYNTPFKWAQGWFYDDATNTTGKRSFIYFAETTLSVMWGIGVDNATSITKYTMVINNSVSASSVSRTTGWHQFQIQWDSSNKYILYIDNTAICSSTAMLYPFTTIEVGTPDTSGNNPIGYFDLVQATTLPYITFKNLSDNQVVLFPVSGDTATSSSGTAILNLNGYFDAFVQARLNSIYNTDPYVVITKTDGKTFRFISDVINFGRGDVYALFELEFSRKATMFDVKKSVKRTDNESNSGVNEGQFFNARDVVSLTLSDLSESDILKLNTWWSYAQNSNSYSVAIDSNDIYFSYLVNNQVSGINYLTGFLGLSGNPPQKSDLIISTNDRQTYENITSTIYSSGKLYLALPLINSYPEISAYPYNTLNAFLKTRRYWPFCINTDKSLNISMANGKVKRWNFTHTFKEEI
jgi:hypothetical protein